MTQINYSKVFENVNAVMKDTQKERDLWKLTFNSASRLLREAQTKEGFKIARPIFERFNLPLTRKFKPSELFELIPSDLWMKDKKNNSYPCYVSRSVEKNEDGTDKKDKNGNLIYKFRLCPIRDNTWTFDKFVKLMSSVEGLKK